MMLLTRALLSLSALSWAVHVHAQSAGMPAPRYLQVPGFKQCLASQQINTYRTWCLPADRPQACPQDSWDALSRLSGVDKMPACEAPVRPAASPPAFTGPDYSGTYDCKGQDSHEGPYDGTVTLALIPAQSTGTQGAYSFKLDVPGYGSYPGHAAAQGHHMGIFFALTDPSTKDFGTGIATFKKNAKGKWTFNKFYYEPEFKGGNHGTETCVQR